MLASWGIELSASAHHSHLGALLAFTARRGMELSTSSQLSSSSRRSHLIRWSSPPPRIIWVPSTNRSGFLPNLPLWLRGFSLDFQVRFLTNNLLMTFWFSSPVSREGRAEFLSINVLDILGFPPPYLVWVGRFFAIRCHHGAL